MRRYRLGVYLFAQHTALPNICSNLVSCLMRGMLPVIGTDGTRHRPSSLPQISPLDFAWSPCTPRVSTDPSRKTPWLSKVDGRSGPASASTNLQRRAPSSICTMREMSKKIAEEACTSTDDCLGSGRENSDFATTGGSSLRGASEILHPAPCPRLE